MDCYEYTFYSHFLIRNKQEQARSTLLNALQVERNNVDELENSLAMVQQNNSAIGEMVASRDSLIDELNDRVAVFEEDKVVLKAALRQLQKEMKDEAPKTKKLMKELKAANSGKSLGIVFCRNSLILIINIDALNLTLNT